MLKKIGKISLLLLIYLVSLIIFELFFGVMNLNQNLTYMEQHGFDNPFAALASFIEAGIYHFIFVSIIAICAKFNKKITNITKNTIYTFPVLTIMLAWPMMVPTMMIARLIQIPF